MLMRIEAKACALSGNSMCSNEACQPRENTIPQTQDTMQSHYVMMICNICIFYVYFLTVYLYAFIMLITMFEFILNKNSFSGLIYITLICIIKNLELSLGCVFISNVVFIHFIKGQKGPL